MGRRLPETNELTLLCKGSGHIESLQRINGQIQSDHTACSRAIFVLQNPVILQ